MRWLVGTVVSAYLCLLLAFNITETRQGITSFLESQLSNALQSKVKIYDIEVGLFNRIVMKDIKIYDQNEEVAFSTDYISAKIKMRELLKGNIAFNTIVLLNTDVNIYRNTKDEPLNIQYIIDALKSDQNQNKSNSCFSIGSLILTRAKISYNENWAETTQHFFNPKHINIENLNANICLKAISNDSVNIRIRHFSAKERSGVELYDLALKIVGNQDGLALTNVKIKGKKTNIWAKEALYLKGDVFNFTGDLRDYDLRGNIVINTIHTDDFVPFVPQFKDLKLGLSGELTYHSEQAAIVSQLNIRERKSGSYANISFVPQFDSIKISNIDLILKELSLGETLLPTLATTFIKNYDPEKSLIAIHKFGQIRTKANLSANLKEGLIKGWAECESDTLGDILANLNWNKDTLITDLSTTKTKISNFINITGLPEYITLNLNTNIAVIDSTSQNVDARLNIIETKINNELLTNIRLTSSLLNDKVSMRLQSENDIFNADISSSVIQAKQGFKDFCLTGVIKALSLEHLGVNDTICHGLWSGNIVAQILVWSNENKHVTLHIDSLNIDREKPYFLHQFNLISEFNEGTHSYLNVNSDFLDIQASGEINSNTILNSLRNTYASHLTVLDHIPNNPGDQADVRIKIKKDDFFNDVLLIPVTFKGGIDIEASLNHKDKYANITAYSEEIQYDGMQIKTPRFYFYSNPNNAYSLLKCHHKIMGEDILWELSTMLKDNTLTSEINWDDQNDLSFFGNLRLNSVFVNTAEDHIHFNTHFSPTLFTLNDTIWNVSSGQISMCDAYTTIDSLIIRTTHNNKPNADSYQKLMVGGTFSKTKHDSISLNLTRIDVGDILNIINFDDVLFDGQATGNVVLKMGKNQPFMNTHLRVKDLKFNHALMGDTEIKGSWQSVKDDIKLNATMKNADTVLTQVDGYISPRNKGLNLNIHAHKTNLFFLNSWVKGIANDIEGWANGYCNLYGPFNKLDFKGQVKANITTNLPSNGVIYDIADANVTMKSGIFHLTEGTITDAFGGRGTLTASLGHRNLKQFNYTLRLESDDLLLYNLPSSSEMPFAARTFASGNVNLQGNSKQLNLDIDATPCKESIIVYSAIPENLANSDKKANFITFRNRNAEKTSIDTLEVITQPKATSDLNLNFNLKINTNPNITLRVLMSDVDSIDMRGHGVLNADYNNANFNLRGIFNIDEGEYKMNVYNVAKRKFALQSGSNINFNGNTDNAALNLKAIYKLQTASLSDLNIGNNFSNRSIPVDCILNITGTPNNPVVNFDLDLPTKSDDEKRMIRSLIATDENLNVQIFSLLITGRFYTNDYTAMATKDDNQNQTTVMANSFLSSTLSTEINEVITNLLGAKNWNFGTNLSTGTSGWSDMEVKGLVSANLFNNRVQFDGNFGYQERKYNVTNNDNFVGDFSLRCKITPSGSLGVKFYSKSNERYFTKSNLTTQGVGIEYKKDFKKFIDLFKKNKDNNN